MKQLILLAVVAASSAWAHFKLMAPAVYSQQDANGSPQKSAPCGQADPGQAVVPTNAVTTLVAGSQVTVTVDEVIFHPGHYRVALAADQASLPADPPVTAGTTPCGSTVINPAPTLPLLADGKLVHTAALNPNPQSFTVNLPAGFTCNSCVLQVVEFMSNHALNNPGGCFYHHCANVKIVAGDGGTAGGAGGGAGGGSGGAGGGSGTAGGSATAGGSGTAGGSATAGGSGTAGGAATAGGSGTAGGTSGTAGGSGTAGSGTGGMGAGVDQGGGCQFSSADSAGGGLAMVLALSLWLRATRRRTS
jgi:hypothetical protein